MPCLPRRTWMLSLASSAALAVPALAQDAPLKPAPAIKTMSRPKIEWQGQTTSHATPAADGTSAAEPTPATPQHTLMVDLFGPSPEFHCRAQTLPYWVHGEFLVWWTKAGNLPVLATTTTSDDPATAGQLGADGTQVVLGNSEYNFGSIPGGRLSAGFSFGSGNIYGIEASGFLLADRGRTQTVQATQDQNLVLARPYINAITNRETVSMVAFPGAFTGTISAETEINEFWGTAINLTANPWTFNNFRVGFLTGFRYVNFGDMLTVRQATTVLGNGVVGFLGQPVTSPNGIRLMDIFDTNNQFYFGQFGMRFGMDVGPWSLDVGTTFGTGGVEQAVTITGSSLLVNGTGQITGAAGGGLLAIPFNEGRWTRSRSANLFEVDAKLSYFFTEQVSAFVGYDFLYLSRLFRAGDQIDRMINTTQVPTSLAFGNPFGPRRPLPTLNSSDFWAQGLTFGVALRF